MFSKKEEKKFFVVRGHKFTLRTAKVGISEGRIIDTFLFYDMMFRAIDGDETAKALTDAIMTSLGLSVILDADDVQVYPPK